MTTSRFLKVACKDCSNETTIFEKASTTISCGVCGATLASPAGGKSKLVGCSIVEILDSE